MEHLTVDQLRKQLHDITGSKLVYVWVDGDRYPAVNVDKGFLREGFVEINVDDEPQYQPTPEEAAFMDAYLRNVASATGDNVLYFLKHKSDEQDHDDWWWTSVMDAWLVWQDAKRFVQGDTK